MSSSYTNAIWRGPMCRVQYRVPFFQRSSQSTRKREAVGNPTSPYTATSPSRAIDTGIVRVVWKYRRGGI